VTPDDFRRIALSMPESVEGSHMGHADFRIGKKIFATIGWPDRAWAMVKLTPEQQMKLVKGTPNVFVPVSGGWGKSGSTNVRLATADKATVKNALAIAWRNIAPKSLLTRLDRQHDATARSSAGHLAKVLKRLRTTLKATGLPEVEEGTSYGTFALKVRGKFLMRVKDADTLVFHCPIEEKEILIEAAPNIYFETDHYKGWPAILVRLSKVEDPELKLCLERVWRLQAPAKLVSQYTGKASAPSKQKTRRTK
jgi:hypothetical protein